jgi:site-specific DNA recombinase
LLDGLFSLDGLKQSYHIVTDLAENDRGASGATFDLPQLSEALRMAHADEYDVLIVRELDRLSRDLAKQLVVEQELKQAGVTIEYVLYDFPDTPEGRLNKNLRAMLAEYEREKIKQRLVRGRKRKAKAGNVVLHGHVPYGYKSVQKDGKTMLEIEEKTAEVVRLIFEWYTVGNGKQSPMSTQGIKRALTEMKIPTSSDLKNCSCPKRVTGYGEWNTTSIWRMLRSTTYIGLWYYGEDNILVEVPAIINKETWDMAQKRMRQNKKYNRRNTRQDYLLQSRVRCAECHNMVRTLTRRSRSGESVRLYYHCQTRDRGLQCTNKYYYRAEWLDSMAWAWIKELLSTPEKLRKGLNDYKRQQDELTKPLRNRLALVEKMIQEEQDKRKRILEVYLEGHITKPIFDTRCRQL